MHDFGHSLAGDWGSSPLGRGWGWVFVSLAGLLVGRALGRFLVVGGHNKNFQKNTSICCGFKRYFITLPTRCHTIHLGWQIRHRWIGSSRQQDMYILRSLAQKGRLRTLSFGPQTSQLWLNPKEIRQRNVRVRCIVSAPLLAYVYNISWRGLLALLILWVRQCEGLRTGISEYRLPRLFISLSLIGWIWGGL